VVETDRVDEFAPVKNQTGNDSIVSSKQIQTMRAARWLEAAGVEIPRRPDGSIDAVIEISPLTALCSEDLKGLDLPDAIEPGSVVSL
jgi:UDP-N-acetylglucosamine/UDP-N-acetylgalactosamine diphosphorylase